MSASTHPNPSGNPQTIEYRHLLDRSPLEFPRESTLWCTLEEAYHRQKSF